MAVLEDFQLEIAPELFVVAAEVQNAVEAHIAVSSELVAVKRKCEELTETVDDSISDLRRELKEGCQKISKKIRSRRIMQDDVMEAIVGRNSNLEKEVRRIGLVVEAVKNLPLAAATLPDDEMDGGVGVYPHLGSKAGRSQRRSQWKNRS